MLNPPQQYSLAMTWFESNMRNLNIPREKHYSHLPIIAYIRLMNMFSSFLFSLFTFNLKKIKKKKEKDQNTLLWTGYFKQSNELTKHV